MGSTLAFAAVLDTREQAKPGTGIPHICAACGRRHEVWVCFRRVALEIPVDPHAPVREVPDGTVAVVGLACAKKLQGISVFDLPRLPIILQDLATYARTPESPSYPRLISEFA